QATQKLAEYYYKVRAGIGFNKTPDVYGAFPTDPYSHTPKQAGAQQPGMTGQVKEEILTRFGELGLIVRDGKINFQPSLLKETEFLAVNDEFKFINLNREYETISLAPKTLAFTYCQVAFVYEITEADVGNVVVTMVNGETVQSNTLALDSQLSSSIFARSGSIKQVNVSIPVTMLLKER
ncbi:MAG: hypothetical protein ACI88H_004151, partial [Cocleimonas sp.]